MSGDDIDYYRRRAEEERARAEAADDPLAKRAHAELGVLFAERARNLPQIKRPRLVPAFSQAD